MRSNILVVNSKTLSTRICKFWKFRKFFKRIQRFKVLFLYAYFLHVICKLFLYELFRIKESIMN